MTITVVIPALDEEQSLPLTLERTIGLGFDRIIVVDGGSRDRTLEVIESAARPRPSAPSPPHSRLTPVTFLKSEAGRARQMNHGAAASQDEVLLFLHADTQLPGEARATIEQALAEPTCVGGRFDLHFSRDTRWGRLIGNLINLRSRWSGIATGDQAIFVRRTVFDQLGGFTDVPIMEDVDFTRRLKRMGRVAALRSKVVASFRRWEHKGPVRTILLMWALRFLYWLGISPARLSRLYTPVR